VIALTSGLVQIPSIAGDDYAVSQFLARKVKALGFEPELYELRNYGDPRRGRFSVVWRIPGRGAGPTLMFNGHLDTEPIAPGYAELGEDPFSGDVRPDGHIYGLGTVNMKGGVAASVYAMKALRDAGFAPQGDVIGAAVVAEIEYGLGTRHLMECGLIPDMAISGEPTNLRIRPAHTGITDVVVTLRGRPTDMAYPDEGKSVTPYLTAFLQAIPGLAITYDVQKYEGYLEPRVNVGHIHGGYEFRTGLHLDSVSVGLSVRAPKGVTPLTVKQDFDRFLHGLRSAVQGLRAEVSILNPVPRFFPPYETATDFYVTQAVAGAHEAVTGSPADWSAPTYGGGDIAILQYYAGVPCVMYGPGGVAGPFTPPERARISDITTATRTYALAALDIGSRSWKEVGGRPKTVS
jgi:acetylornithine deacetylase/succinyl-diaminopimelate desuccinylase-like protein